MLSTAGCAHIPLDLNRPDTHTERALAAYALILLHADSDPYPVNIFEQGKNSKTRPVPEEEIALQHELSSVFCVCERVILASIRHFMLHTNPGSHFYLPRNTLFFPLTHPFREMRAPQATPRFHAPSRTFVEVCLCYTHIYTPLLHPCLHINMWTLQHPTLDTQSQTNGPCITEPCNDIRPPVADAAAYA